MITRTYRLRGDKAKAARLLDIGRKTLTVNSSSTRSNEGVAECGMIVNALLGKMRYGNSRILEINKSVIPWLTSPCFPIKLRQSRLCQAY